MALETYLKKEIFRAHKEIRRLVRHRIVCSRNHNSRAPALEMYLAFDPQTMMVASGVLGLTSAVLGSFAFQTSAGKFALIGGLALVIAVSLLLSFTTIVRVERSGAQPGPTVSEVEAQR